eukprot:12818737-Ditylum_brightwellii.AAC.1
MLCAEKKLREALAMGVKVLTCLGESLLFGFSDKSIAITDFTKIRSSFESMTDDEFYKIQEMEDRDALAAMSFTSDLLAIAHFINQDQALCLFIYMLQLSLTYG